MRNEYPMTRTLLPLLGGIAVVSILSCERPSPVGGEADDSRLDQIHDSDEQLTSVSRQTYAAIQVRGLIKAAESGSLKPIAGATVYLAEGPKNSKGIVSEKEVILHIRNRTITPP